MKKVSNIDSPVSIAFVGENTIKKLNKEYRGIDGVTDVLTFIYRDDDQYGEIVMCPSKITRNARKFSETFEKELYRTLIHGLLHLSGYDHERDSTQADDMMKLQEYILNSIPRKEDF